MSSLEAFNAVKLEKEVKGMRKLDRQAYRDNRARLCVIVQKDLKDVTAAEHQRRRAFIDHIDLAYPENPGWHFYDEFEWQKLQQHFTEFQNGSLKFSELDLASPFEGRKHHLQSLWQVVGKVFKGRKDTINEWNDFIDTFTNDKSNLEDDEKWYRIQTALHAALYDESDVGKTGPTVTPTDVLKKLDMKYPAAPRPDRSAHSPTSSHAPDHNHSEQPKSSSSTHPHDARNSYDHVLHDERKHSAHAQGHSPTAATAPHHGPTSQSSPPPASSHSRHGSHGHRALERFHKVFKPHKRSPSSSHSRHTPRDHRHVRERMAGHFHKMLGRSSSHKRHAGSSSHSLGSSPHVPLRYSVLYPST